MKYLYIDTPMGIAGDMFTAALLSLVDENTILEFNHLGLPHIQYVLEKKNKNGIVGNHIRVIIDGEEEHHHHHEEEHHHHHHGHSLHDLDDIIDHLYVNESLKQDIKNVYQIIAKAESEVHGMPMDQIHFHEVGTMDALADVTAVCYLINQIKADKIICSPICTGSGTVKCAHGILPVPAPATAIILKDIPSYAGTIKSELATPTGVALLKYFVNEFNYQPVMKVSSIGYGLGNKEFDTLNAVKVVLGESDSTNDSIYELSCNIDDMSGEEIGFAVERLYELKPLDVNTIPYFGKKNRPGVILQVLVSIDKKDELVKGIMKYTSTLGVREVLVNRTICNRTFKVIHTPLGDVSKKVSTYLDISKEKYEYEDIKKIAISNEMTIEEVIEYISKYE